MIFIQVNNVLKYGFLCFLTKIVCLTLHFEITDFEQGIDCVLPKGIFENFKLVYY